MKWTTLQLIQWSSLSRDSQVSTC